MQSAAYQSSARDVYLTSTRSVNTNVSHNILRIASHVLIRGFDN